MLGVRNSVHWVLKNACCYLDMATKVNTHANLLQFPNQCINSSTQSKKKKSFKLFTLHCIGKGVDSLKTGINEDSYCSLKQKHVLIYIYLTR